MSGIHFRYRDDCTTFHVMFHAINGIDVLQEVVTSMGLSNYLANKGVIYTNIHIVDHPDD